MVLYVHCSGATLSSLHHEEEKRALIIYKIFYNTLVHWSTDKPFSCSMENSVKRRCTTRSWGSEPLYTTYPSPLFHWTLITYPKSYSHSYELYRPSYWPRFYPWRRWPILLFPLSKENSLCLKGSYLMVRTQYKTCFLYRSCGRWLTSLYTLKSGDRWTSEEFPHDSEWPAHTIKLWAFPVAQQ